MNRTKTINSIRTGLKKRTGLAWSVRGGTRSAYNWIRISAPNRRLDDQGYMTFEDRKTLTEALGLSSLVHQQFHSVPASNQHYREYVDRANGVTPTVSGEFYWDYREIT